MDGKNIEKMYPNYTTQERKPMIVIYIRSFTCSSSTLSKNYKCLDGSIILLYHSFSFPHKCLAKNKPNSYTNIYIRQSCNSRVYLEILKIEKNSQTLYELLPFPRYVSVFAVLLLLSPNVSVLMIQR